MCYEEVPTLEQGRSFGQSFCKGWDGRIAHVGAHSKALKKKGSVDDILDQVP